MGLLSKLKEKLKEEGVTEGVRYAVRAYKRGDISASTFRKIVQAAIIEIGREKDRRKKVRKANKLWDYLQRQGLIDVYFSYLEKGARASTRKARRSRTPRRRKGRKKSRRKR